MKRTFGKLVEPEVVEAMIEGREERPPLTESQIEVVLVFVRGNTPKEISELIGRVGQVATAHQAFIDGLSASVIVATFGAHPASHPAPGARAALVAGLLEQFGASIKVVHGAGQGCYGLFGVGDTLRYSFIFPGFDAALGLLSRAEFGTAQEFKP
ncbi:MAG TPA: hypothetical protein VN578_11785 [Candidatus Binatia bacterium]|nr:hypothetical protein [Candidatus Binatia bacterium]